MGGKGSGDFKGNKHHEVALNVVKEEFLKHLRNNLGLVTPSCKACDLYRTTFYKWYEADPDFKQQVDDIKEEAIDFVESQLFKQIKDGGAAQTIFYLKTKARHRGYIEQVDNVIKHEQVNIQYILPAEDAEIMNKKIELPENFDSFYLPEKSNDKE